SAAQVKKDAKAAAPLEAKAIAEFVKSGNEKNNREEKINLGNSLKVSNFDNAKSQCTTTYNGQLVHVQALSNVEAKVQSASLQARGNDVQRAVQQNEQQAPQAQTAR